MLRADRRCQYRLLYHLASNPARLMPAEILLAKGGATNIATRATTSGCTFRTCARSWSPIRPRAVHLDHAWPRLTRSPAILTRARCARLCASCVHRHSWWRRSSTIWQCGKPRYVRNLLLDLVDGLRTVDSIQLAVRRVVLQDRRHL